MLPWSDKCVIGSNILPKGQSLTGIFLFLTQCVIFSTDMPCHREFYDISSWSGGQITAWAPPHPGAVAASIINPIYYILLVAAVTHIASFEKLWGRRAGGEEHSGLGYASNDKAWWVQWALAACG